MKTVSERYLRTQTLAGLSDTLPTATGPVIFAGLGSWAYQWTDVVGLVAGCYCSLHLLKCCVGWLSSLLVLPVAQQWHLSYYYLGAFMVQLTIEFDFVSAGECKQTGRMFRFFFLGGFVLMYFRI